MKHERQLPIGAEVLKEGTHFRVWAPDRRHLTIVFENGRALPLKSESNGYFSGLAMGIWANSLYRLQLDDRDLVPDPASRFQPRGPHGPSQIIDANEFTWTDRGWNGLELQDLVIYEMHIGTFTQEGSWSAATRELAELARVGINCIEIMPVAEFTGEFGWGYDGVNLFAPTHLYGSPDDFRRFVNAAHSHRISVILDVVYNHLGPDGNYLGKFSQSYFTDRYQTDWGTAINFDGPESAPIREFFLANTTYWIEEFHLDGLRLDATQNIYDNAPPAKHILSEIGERARAAGQGRTIVLIAENEPQKSQLCRPIAHDGYGLNAVWNDDYHHSAMVALTGRKEAYYTDYFGTPQEFISAAKYGYLYQGQWYSWQKQHRGEPGFDLPLASYINFIQNHDQVANSGRGLRAHQLSSLALYRAIMGLTLLMPGTPMLFQGQEFAASTPFLYFADHRRELATMVEEGRAEFLRQFPSLADERMQNSFAKPNDSETFNRCKLNFAERDTHAAEYLLTKDLLTLRRTDPAFQPQSRRDVDGAVLSPHCFVLRFFHNGAGDRLLIVNLGHNLDLQIVPEPLLSPPLGMKWRLQLSTEEPQYGGSGVRPPEPKEGGWHIPAQVAMVLCGEVMTAPAVTIRKKKSTQ